MNLVLSLFVYLVKSFELPFIPFNTNFTQNNLKMKNSPLKNEKQSHEIFAYKSSVHGMKI